MKVYTSGNAATVVMSGEKVWLFTCFLEKCQFGVIQGGVVNWRSQHPINVEDDDELEALTIASQHRFTSDAMRIERDIRLYRGEPLLRWSNGVMYVTQDSGRDITLPALGKGLYYEADRNKAWYREGDKGMCVALVRDEHGNSSLKTSSFEIREDKSLAFNFVSRIADERVVWLARKQGKPVKRVVTSGRGFCGGHNTAERLGWATCHFPPERAARLWWEVAEEGRFTGYQPYTISIV